MSRIGIPFKSKIMREIKFRGLYKGHMVHGNLIDGIDPEGKRFFQIERSDAIDFALYDVEFNSIGQYTGIKDTKEREVYEQDIYIEEVETDEGDERFTLICTWISEYCSFAMLGLDEWREYNYQGVIDFDKAMRYSYMMDDAEFSRLVFVGTVPQNPELLNQ